MAKSTDFQYAQSYTAGQLVAKLVENYAGASRESAQGMELLLKVAKQYENVGADKTQGRLFEIIETTKFNVKAAELGETIRAATTDSLGDPHAAEDIVIRQGETVLKEIQAKSSEKAANLARMISQPKYGEMDRLVNANHADRVQELVDKRAASGSIYRDDYAQASKHVEKELHYNNVSSGGTEYAEARDAAENPTMYAVKSHAATFGEQLFHAARTGAIAGAVVGGSIGVISEGIQFARGEKTLIDSVLDAGKNTLKSAANGATVASLAKGIAYIGKDTFFVRGNVATAVASSAIRITQLTVKYIKGELSSEEYMISFGENGVSTLSGIFSGMAAGMVFGPAGAVIGGIVGLFAGQQAYQALVMARQSLQLTMVERERVEKLSADMIAVIEEQQQEINMQLQEQIGQLGELEEALASLGTMRLDSLFEQAPSLIMKAANVLNVTFQYKTQEEFDAFMLDDSLELKL